jgi:adenosylmethionine---8-amino-7-oxononanoate aminotransferase
MDRPRISRHHVAMETNDFNTHMLTEAESLRRRDLSVLWHPCTQMAEHPDTLPLIPIRRGRGVWLEGVDGKRYLDAVSSWWTNLFGHAEPRIAAAIAAQAQELEHVIYAGFSHEPGLKLAEALVAATPQGLSRVFYADNGSAAVEIALKMSFHHFYNRGDFKRSKFISLSNGYHGETLGALSMADIPLYRRVYAPLLLQPLFAPSPDAYDADEGESAESYALRCVEKLEQLFELHTGEICALVLEPLVQCAGGMRMHHPVYLQRARELCTQFGAHLIADEIAVGFGRTGTLFACEQADTSPDFMCLSKGLTGGFMPMSAVLTTQHVYESFLDDSRERAFLHSHSYTGNPLACAAAFASLSIFSSDDVLEKNKATAHKMKTLAEPFKDHPHVAEVRQCGMILAIEMVQDKKTKTAFTTSERRGLRAYRHAIEHGVVLRPLGDILYWMPPYCIDDEALQHLASVTATALNEATR